jgi:hypothetical protein
MRRVDSAGCHREYPALLRDEYSALWRPVWRRAVLRCVRVGRAAAKPMRDEACFRRARPHLFQPNALHLRAACLLASKPAGRGRLVGPGASIRHWLRAGRLPALAPASLQAAVRTPARILERT